MDNQMKNIIPDTNNEWSTNNPQISFETDKKNLMLAVNRHVRYRNINSILVLGRQNCEKLKLIKSVLKTFSHDTHAIVYLNGIIHKKFESTFLSIVEQLKVPNFFGSLVKSKLSDHVCSINFWKTLEYFNLLFLKSIIIVVENIEQFCIQNQKLLYVFYHKNIHFQVPVTIIGVSTYFNVFEMIKPYTNKEIEHSIVIIDPKLSDLEYSLLMSILNKVKNNPDVPFNFPLIYSHYMASASNSPIIMKKEKFVQVFQRLLMMHFVMSVVPKTKDTSVELLKIPDNCTKATEYYLPPSIVKRWLNKNTRLFCINQKNQSI